MTDTSSMTLKERKAYFAEMDQKYNTRSHLATSEAAEFIGKPQRYIRVLVYEQNILKPAAQPSTRSNLYEKGDLVALRDQIFQEAAQETP